MLNTTRSPEAITIQGIGLTPVKVEESCVITFTSYLDDSEIYKIPCLVIPTITGSHPAKEMRTDYWKIPKDFTLADPSFMRPIGIDLLLGSEVFWKILQQRQYSQGDDLPVLTESRLGWIVTGSVNNSKDSSYSSGVHKSVVDMGTDVQQVTTTLHGWIRSIVVEKSKQGLTRMIGPLNEFFRYTSQHFLNPFPIILRAYDDIVKWYEEYRGPTMIGKAKRVLPMTNSKGVDSPCCHTPELAYKDYLTLNVIGRLWENYHRDLPEMHPELFVTETSASCTHRYHLYPSTQTQEQ